MLPQHWEAFARRGIASLSWDKPGVGDSSGDWTTQTMQDQAQEALAAIRFLTGHWEILPTKIGAWGISQAGWVLPLVYALSSVDVAFLIAVSVPVGTGDEQELFRIAHQLPADGYPALAVDKALAFSQLRIYLKNQHAPFDCIAQLQHLVEEERWFAEVGAWDADAYDFLRWLEGKSPSHDYSKRSPVRCWRSLVSGTRLSMGSKALRSTRPHSKKQAMLT